MRCSKGGIGRPTVLRCDQDDGDVCEAGRSTRLESMTCRPGVSGSLEQAAMREQRSRGQHSSSTKGRAAGVEK